MKQYISWLPGIATAMAGVAIARLLVPELPDQYQSAGFIIGTSIAIVGVFITAAGSGKKR